MRPVLHRHAVSYVTWDDQCNGIVLCVYVPEHVPPIVKFWTMLQIFVKINVGVICSV
jgi:hypothetical protein